MMLPKSTLDDISVSYLNIDDPYWRGIRFSLKSPVRYYGIKTRRRGSIAKTGFSQGEVREDYG